MGEQFHILLIEDEAGLILSLVDRLESEGYKVTSANDGLNGEKEALGETSYDLILLDVMLPKKDGFQVCKTIREAGNRIPILMLTARNTNIDTILGLQLGADDYLAKPFDMQILLARIDALLRRAAYQNQNKTDVKEKSYTFGEYTLDLRKQELYRGTSLIPLNAQEYRLLKFLVKNPERIIDRNELLDEVWSYDSTFTTRTVDVHIAWLRQKLGEKEIPKHIRTVRGYGYKFVKDCEL